MQSFPAFGLGWIETMTKMSGEMANFVFERVKQDVMTQKDLLQANGIGEIQQIQSEFFQKAMDDYSAEMTKLVEMRKKLALTMTSDKELKAGSEV